MHQDACGQRQANPYYRYVTENTSGVSFSADIAETDRFFIAHLKLFHFKSSFCQE
jgi:hypothetical protein